MTTIVTRAGKGSPLTNTEMDTNLTNLNTDKLEAATIATLTNKTIDLTDNTVTGTKAEFDTACSDDNFIFDSEIGSVVQAYDATLAGIAADTTMLGGFRNKIIGGDFTTNPWQMGTSFTGQTTNTFGADRWRINYVSTAVVDVLKIIDAPTASEAGVYTQHCHQINCTTADTSIAAADNFQLIQPIEGLNAASFGFGQAGTRYITLSFWVKSTLTGTYCVAFRNSAANRSYVSAYTINSASTWEKKIITIPVDTSGTWAYDTGIGLNLAFILAAGSNFQTTADSWQAGNFIATSAQVNFLNSNTNQFKIALVQLEAGSVATPFETRSVGQELALCRRYTRVQAYYVPATTAQNLGTIDMRDVPTISGGGAGFTSTGTTADQLIAYQTAGGVQTLTLVSEL